MQPFQAIILGVIQGLTEFLPVSSSGHLVLFQHLFGLKEPELFFDISVHVGTTVAVLIIFRAEIWKIITAVFHFFSRFLKKELSVAHIYEDSNVKLAFLIVVGNIPTAILGLLFHKVSDQLFGSVFIAGLMLLVTGFLLWSTRMLKQTGKSIAGFSTKNAIFIGLIQGLAILPGISRSGSTIAAGLFIGLNRETAARFSFLLSIPAILGAQVLAFKNMPPQTVLTGEVTLLGSLTSCAVGYCALKLLLLLVKKGRLHIFAPYCWLAGVSALILGW